MALSKEVFSSQVTSGRRQSPCIPSLHSNRAQLSGKRVIVTMPPRSIVLHITGPEELDDGERVEADDGYRGCSKYVKCPKNMTSTEVTAEMSSNVRSRHETVNK